jgi:hypothetical protein
VGGQLGALAEPSGHFGGSIAGCWLATCLEIQARAQEGGFATTALLSLTIPILLMKDELCARGAARSERPW